MFYLRVANAPQTLHKCCKYMYIVPQLTFQIKIFFHISLVTIVEWNSYINSSTFNSIIPHSTYHNILQSSNIFQYSTIVQNNAGETLWKMECGRIYSNSSTFMHSSIFVHSSIFIHSSILHLSLEQRGGNIVEKWNVEEYIYSSTLHIHVICNIEECMKLEEYCGM